MKRKMATIFLGTFVTLSLSAVQLLAQGRARGGGGHMGPPPRAVFNNPAPVAVRPNPAPVARPVVPRPTFSGHPTPPFVTAPVTLGTRVLPSQFNQGFERRGFFSRPFGGFYSTYYPYSPYIWPMSLYPGPYVEPYLAPYSAPYTPEPEINQNEIDLAN